MAESSFHATDVTPPDCFTVLLPHGVAILSEETKTDRHACRRTRTVVASISRPDTGYRQQQWQTETVFLFAISYGCSLRRGHSSAPQYTSKFYPHEGAPSWLSLGDGSTQYCRPGTLEESAPNLCCGAVYLLGETLLLCATYYVFSAERLAFIISSRRVHAYLAGYSHGNGIIWKD